MLVVKASLGILAAWVAGFVVFIQVANAYCALYYPDEVDPVHFEIAGVGLVAGLAEGLIGTGAAVAWLLTAIGRRDRCRKLDDEW